MSTLPNSITGLAKPTRYMGVTETAKLIRQALKEAFPEIKFSVRSSRYAGGSSIDVSWEDGPTEHQVEAIAQAFQGGYFDGMTDYKGHNTHTMNGEPVRFGGDFVFCTRHVPAHKVEAAQKILGQVEPDALYSFMVKFGLRGGDVMRLLDLFQGDPRGLASAFLRHVPLPQYEGRRSKLAESVSFLSSH